MSRRTRYVGFHSAVPLLSLPARLLSVPSALVISVPLMALSACHSTAEYEGQDDSELTASELDALEGNSADASTQPNLGVNALMASAQDGADTEGDATISEASAPSSQDDFLDDEARRLGLREQKNQVLIDLYLERAREQMDLTEFGEAERQILRAAELDPENPEVRTMLAEVRALQGDTAGQAGVLLDDLTDETILRRQQLESDAREGVRKAELLMERGDYDTAIAELNIALDHVRWAGLAVDWNGVDERAEELLLEAKAGREAAREQQLEEAQRATTELLRAEEDAQRRAKRDEVDGLIERGIGAFRTEAYQTAMQFANQALRIDPKDTRAIDLREAAMRARMERGDREFVAKKNAQFKRWEQEMMTYRIPFTDILNIDADDWNALTEQRSNRFAINREDSVDVGDLALNEELRETVIQGFVVEGVESLAEVVDQFAAITGLPVVVDPTAEDAVQGEGIVYDIPLRNSIRAIDALDIVADNSGEEVTWAVRHGTVLFTTREKAGGELRTLPHDISDLTLQLPSFQAPRLDQLRLLEDLFDDDGGGPFGGLGDPSTQLEADSLVELVQRNVMPEQWEDDGVSIATYNDTTMIVTHRPEVQRGVQSFLEELRRFNSMMVTIDTKFLTVADNFIQEIGVEWRGKDNPGVPFTDLDDVTAGLEDNASLGLDNGGSGVDSGNAAGSPGAGFFYDDGQDGDFKGSTSNFFNSPLGSALSTIGGLTTEISLLDDLELNLILRAIEKQNDVRVVNSQQLSVYNSQQASVSVVNQQAYVQDFDVEVATNISIADPVINVLTEGVSLQVKPTVAYDRRNLTLEVQPTIANVVALTPFATSLGNQIGSAVEFVLPELEVQSLKTTASIPDGGTILIGGLSRIRNVERRAEVPWLANVPILGFFFKEEGYSDEKQSLMILMKAWITDVRESVAELER